MAHHDNSFSTQSIPAPLRSFTRQEVERLAALRQRFHLPGDHFERVIDERRLEFARWLVEHQRLSEQE
jgi:hypothetical protein